MLNILLLLVFVIIGENTDVIFRDTLPVRDISFWKKPRLRVGYSEELYGIGAALRPKSLKTYPIVLVK
jgi:hypothetical protein